MELVGRDNYKLIYTLMDNPEHQIKKDFKWNNPNQLDYEDFKKDFVYSDLESNLRIKVFEIKRDEEILDKLKERVLESRNYIKQLLNK